MQSASWAYARLKRLPVLPVSLFSLPTPLTQGFARPQSPNSLTRQPAENNRDKDYIGIEVHKPGVGILLAQLERQGITNVRVFYHDAIDVHKLVHGSGNIFPKAYLVPVFARLSFARCDE
jgi:hypothetical protein